MSSMRVEDMHNMLSSKTTLEAADKKTARGFKTIVPKTKNDPKGTGPICRRTFFLPCSCLKSLHGNEKAKFQRDLRKDPFVDCVTHCAFEKLWIYYKMCPDNTGQLSEMEIENNIMLKPLMFWRVRATTGLRRMITTPIRVENIKDSIKRINLRLPEAHRLSKPTAHVIGRRTHITNAVNIGVDPTVIALYSKHRDPKALKGYIDPDNSSLCWSSLSISNNLNNTINTDYLGGHPFNQTDDCDDDF